MKTKTKQKPTKITNLEYLKNFKLGMSLSDITNFSKDFKLVSGVVRYNDRNIETSHETYSYNGDISDLSIHLDVLDGFIKEIYYDFFTKNYK